mmetsp:Transcript_48900/g.122469  ORF Transcript_48900/g.122469 Transcript_48900/m.122469 type:complete len:251 (+) Transcript_48900:1202-1954(+)
MALARCSLSRWSACNAARSRSLSMRSCSSFICCSICLRASSSFLRISSSMAASLARCSCRLFSRFASNDFRSSFDSMIHFLACRLPRVAKSWRPVMSSLSCLSRRFQTSSSCSLPISSPSSSTALSKSCWIMSRNSFSFCCRSCSSSLISSATDLFLSSSSSSLSSSLSSSSRPSPSASELFGLARSSALCIFSCLSCSLCWTKTSFLRSYSWLNSIILASFCRCCSSMKKRSFSVRSLYCKATRPCISR